MSRTILAIDPGNVESAWVEYDPKTRAVVSFGKMANENVIIIVDEFSRTNVFDNEVVIEQVACMGMAVGEEVFETVFWSGRFAERCRTTWSRLKRHSVKMHICQHPRANDSNIRQAIIDRYGGESKAIGGVKCPKCKGKGWIGRDHAPCPVWKHEPGPLFGITKDVWAALALAITYAETKLATAV